MDRENLEMQAILEARHGNPHAFLGMHAARNGVIVRVFVDDAVRCEVIAMVSGECFPLELRNSRGFFEGFFANRRPFSYRLRAFSANGTAREFYDPYSFLPTISQCDAYLFNEGNLHCAYHFLGANPRTVDGIPGVAFAVWAPNGKRVSLVGQFNHWDGRYFPMRPLGSSGIWELFVPGLCAGLLYKYEIWDRDGHLHLKSDPYGAGYESPPNNASLICDLGDYVWHDLDWLERRRKMLPFRATISIYEVHLGSWKRVPEENFRPLTYREIAPQLANYCLEMGFTHVQLMPVMEHPLSGSWGYQVTGFFAPTHRYGSPQDFMYLVDTLHRHGIGVIVDWVPAHFPKDRFALARFDGTPLYEYADPRVGEHRDWGTLVFDYGKNEVRNFLLSSALCWCDRYHVDGFRVDAVASMLYLDYSRRSGEWIPNRYGGHENIEAIAFLREFNVLIHRYYPGIMTIAEESTHFAGVTKPVFQGGLGFDFKWNMGWMHDILSYFSKDPIYRRYDHSQLTFAMLYQYSEHFILALSHDEVVHGKASLLGKMPAAETRQKAQMLRSLYGYMWTWPGKKSLFMGGEFGQSSEWFHGESLSWHLLHYEDHSGIRQWVRDLNRLYGLFPWLGFYDDESRGFSWINPDDGNNSVLSYLRHGNGPSECLLIVCNFTPVARENYRVGVPFSGIWKELLNSDAKIYGGSGGGNWGSKSTESISCNSMNVSLNLYLPPHGAIIFHSPTGKSTMGE